MAKHARSFPVEKPFECKSHLTTSNVQRSVACRRDFGAMRDLWLPSAAQVALCVFPPEAKLRVCDRERRWATLLLGTRPLTCKLLFLSLKSLCFSTATTRPSAWRTALVASRPQSRNSDHTRGSGNSAVRWLPGCQWSSPSPRPAESQLLLWYCFCTTFCAWLLKLYFLYKFVICSFFLSQICLVTAGHQLIKVQP